MTSSPLSSLGDALPASASPEVGFISQIHLNPATELRTTGERGIDPDDFRRYVRTLEVGGELADVFSFWGEPLVGSPETVAAATLDYIDLGALALLAEEVAR